MGIDIKALSHLQQRAEQEKSSALVVLKDGKLVHEQYWGVGPEPLVSMSVSKSVVSLAVGLLIAEKKITSIDQSAADFIRSWRKDDRRAVTLRHLLNHTSGLGTARAHRIRGSLRRHAQRAKLLYTPGERFRYNNNAVDLLALVVHRASGEFLDDYLRKRLFWPMDIENTWWKRFADGHPRVAGELFIRPVDLAKIGQMLLQNGKYAGKQIVPASWVRRSMRASQSIFPPHGLLWWREAAFVPRLDEQLLELWGKEGVEESMLVKVRTLMGKRFRNEEHYKKRLERLLGSKAYRALWTVIKERQLPAYRAIKRGKQRGFAARGWLGQYLVVFPQKKLVGVRMRAIVPQDRRRREQDHYPDFADHLHRLVP